MLFVGFHIYTSRIQHLMFSQSVVNYSEKSHPFPEAHVGMVYFGPLLPFIYVFILFSLGFRIVRWIHKRFSIILRSKYQELIAQMVKT